MLGDCITTSVYERNTKNAIILHIESKRAPKYCPKCGHPHLVKNGFRTRDFISLPIGGKMVILRMKVCHYKCKLRIVTKVMCTARLPYHSKCRMNLNFSSILSSRVL